MESNKVRDRAGSISRSSGPPADMLAASVILHERVANWSRQIRPRFQGWPIRWSETRSAASLVEAASRSVCPVVVVGLDDRAARGLRDLDEALQVSPGLLSLVLDPLDRLEVAETARALGATLVLPGLVVPPEVERVLLRWLPIARRRGELEGWSASREPEASDEDRLESLEWADSILDSPG